MEGGGVRLADMAGVRGEGWKLLWLGGVEVRERAGGDGAGEVLTKCSCGHSIVLVWGGREGFAFRCCWEEKESWGAGMLGRGGRCGWTRAMVAASAVNEDHLVNRENCHQNCQTVAS